MHDSSILHSNALLRKDQAVHLQVALNAAQIGIYETDFNTGSALLSPAACQLFGFASPTCCPTRIDLMRRIHPDDHAVIAAAVAGSITSGVAHCIEFRALLPNGNTRSLAAHGSVMCDAQGQPQGVYGIIWDVEERLQAQRDKQAEIERQRRDKSVREQQEEALRRSEERLQTALQAGNMGIWDWNCITDILTWSPETAGLYGLSPDAAEGKFEDFLCRIHPDDVSGIEMAFNTALRDGALFQYEHRILLEQCPEQGGTRWLLTIGRALYNDAGIPVRMSGTVTDVTDRKRLEAQLLQAQKMDGIGRLAGGIAHDFNNLLSVILGYAEMVEMELQADTQAMQNVQNIQYAATRAAKLTRQLLAFARRQVIEPRVLDPNLLILGMTQMLKPLVGEQIEFQTRFTADVYSVRADPNQIEQVIVNLVVNARDAMPNGGNLSIQTDNVSLTDVNLHEHATVVPGVYVMIAISDTGMGMTREVKERLFEPFFTTKGTLGTGLGLATCYGIIKQSSGYIWVYSEAGHGTTVKVYLPRADQLALPVSEDRFTTAVTRGTETVLVVEDEPLLRNLAVGALRRNGYSVIEAENGVVALSVAQEYQGRIDLLVTDAIMPQMGGVALAERLLTDRPELRVLYASGYMEEVIAMRTGLPPNSRFLQKPFSAVALLAKVRETLTC